jgi:hypothetical protein
MENIYKKITVRALKLLNISLLLIVIGGCGIFSQTSVPSAHVKLIASFEYNCTNDIEIQCDASGCVYDKNQQFTPMNVNFNNLGNLSVCAYSGCYEGVAEIRTQAEFLILHGERFPFSTDDDLLHNIAISLDLNDNIGVIKVGAFAQPLSCKAIST